VPNIHGSQAVSPHLRMCGRALRGERHRRCAGHCQSYRPGELCCLYA